MTQTELDQYAFLVEHRRKDPFDNPTCKATESNFFEYLWHCRAESLPVELENILTQREDSLLPARCSVIRKPGGYGFETALVVESSDKRLPGFIVSESMSKPPKHLFTRPKRALFLRARYYFSSDSDRVNKEGLRLIAEIGVTQAIIQLLHDLGIATDPLFTNNIQNFSNWINLRAGYVRDSWPRSIKPSWYSGQ